jgi:tetratricopeptide (TPR) repeat protein
MKQPTTPEELKELHNLLQRNPQEYLRIVNQWIDENPLDPHPYFDRHFAWMKIGDPRRALDDMNTSIKLEPDQYGYLARGEVHRHLGQYQQAAQDFATAEAIDPENWERDATGLLFQADAHARLGREQQALDCCNRLPDDFWTPGIDGAPGGGKAEIADELRRRAFKARRASAKTRG